MSLVKARAILQGPGATPWQWDPTDMDSARVTLSASGGKNVIATSNGTAGDGGVSAWMGRKVGKWYFEFVNGAAWSGGDTGTGCLKAAASHANFGSSGTLGCALFPSSAMWNGSSLGNSGVTPVANDVIGWAVDLDNNLNWCTRDGVNWSYTGSPSGGTLGKAGGWSVGDLVKPAACFNSGTALTLTIRLRKSAFSYTIPSGFTAWEGW